MADSSQNTDPNALPLTGIRVLDFSQYLAGPSCALRLADLGADVIKVERSDGGDQCRKLVIANQRFDDDSVLFHTINRNKRSFAADLKNPQDLEQVKRLIKVSDVMIHNFRPGIMERLGLSWEAVQQLNPRMVYGAVTGYGDKGPWRDKPGQDLLVQSLSGMAWLSGDADQGPVPTGVPAADVLTGAHLAQGVLAALVRRSVTGRGARIDVSLMESLFDLQFEIFTAFLRDGKPPQRGSVNSAGVVSAAPYGIYATGDGYLAIAMMPVDKLGALVDNADLARYDDPAQWFARRDEIKAILRDHLATQTTQHWLDRLEPADVWCARVMDWPQLVDQEAFKALELTQQLRYEDGQSLNTTRCPIRIDGRRITASRGAPRLGQHTDEIRAQLQLTPLASA
ncbi:MAG: CaiB/BaiF CoA-transferase family protein [Burkholderiaceae bacterium]